MELGKSGYCSQIAAFIRNRDYQKAYNLSKEFLGRFPNESIAHYLLSESAFWTRRYEEAAHEARIAYNKSSADDDMLACAISAGSAYFAMKQYLKGLSFLRQVEAKRTDEDLERLLAMFSVAVDDQQEAAAHLAKLYEINQKAALDLARRYLGS